MSSSEAAPALTDPWSVARPAATPGPRRSAAGWLLRWGAAAAVGAAAPSAALFLDGRRRDAVLLLLAAALWEAVLVVAARAGRAGPAVVVAIGACAVAVAPGVVGRGPAAAAVAAVVLAHGSLAGWTFPSWTARPRLAPLALLPLIAAEAAWVRSNRGTAFLLVRPVTFGLLAVAALVLAAHRWAPAPTARVEHAVRTGVVAVAGAIGTALLLAIALPILYLPGALSRAVRRASHPSQPASAGRTGWLERSLGVGDARRDARRPFATTERRDRTRRMAIGTLTAMSLVAAGAALVAVRRQEPAARDTKGPLVIKSWNQVRYADLPAFREAPWANALQDELYGSSFTGPLVHVANGVRTSSPPTPCACRTLKVWFFGGSAAFGIGQRDEGTIASSLVRHAGEAGVSIEMQNMGVNGYTLWNDFTKFAQRLALSTDRPDLVVFYDGFNDVLATVLHTALKGIDRQGASVLADQEVVEYNERVPSLAPHGGPPAIGLLAIDKYEGVKRQLEALAGAEGIATAFVFQPHAFGSMSRLGDFGGLTGPSAQDMASSEVAQTFAAAAEALPDDVVDLHALLDDAPSPVFISPVHHNEVGADLVGEALARRLRPTFDRLLATR